MHCWIVASKQKVRNQERILGCHSQWNDVIPIRTPLIMRLNKASEVFVITKDFLAKAVVRKVGLRQFKMQ